MLNINACACYLSNKLNQMFFLYLLSSQKCDYFRNFRPKNVRKLKIFVGFL